MVKRSLFIAALTCILAAFATASPRPAQNDTEEYKETFTGTLVGIGGALGGRTATFTLRLNGTNSRDATARYAELLRSKGQDALLDQLHDKDLGTFSLTGQVGRDVNFAYIQQTPEGRRVTVLFERWLQPFEVRNGTRSQDYPFTYLEFSLDKNGKGNGTMIGAAKVYFDKDDPQTLNVENFATYPLRVVDVKAKR